jgi:rubredoxin
MKGGNDMADERLEAIKTVIRQTPLEERLTEGRDLISKLCSQGRPPRMSIPVNAADEDFFLIVTLEDALNALQSPMPIITYCPKCGAKHVDAPNPEMNWDNPPHKSHLCHVCGYVTRPADFPTTGVAEIKTRGQRDMPKSDLALVAVVWSAIRNLRHLSHDRTPGEPGVLDGPLWGRVSHVLGIGSTSAIQLCRAADCDPHEEHAEPSPDTIIEPDDPRTVDDLIAWKQSATTLLMRYSAIADTFGGDVGDSRVETLEAGVAQLRDSKRLPVEILCPTCKRHYPSNERFDALGLWVIQWTCPEGHEFQIQPQFTPWENGKPADLNG